MGILFNRRSVNSPQKRRTRAKRIVIIAAFLAILGTALYRGSGYALDYFSKQAIQKAAFFSKTFGAGEPQAWFESANWLSPMEVEWKGVGLNFQQGKYNFFRIRVGRVTLRARDAGLSRFLVTLHDLNVDRRPMNARAAITEPISFSTSTAEFKLNIDPANYEQGIKDLARESLNFLKGEPARIVVRVDGKLRFRYHGKPAAIRIYSTYDSSGTRLIVDSRDLQKLLSETNLKISDAELALIAGYPTRIAPLLTIKNYASETAEAEYQRDKTFPGDAYRHILWSYLLTKEFGAEFAEQVTNAHEEGEEASKGTAKEQDLANNALGRELAIKGAEESDIRPFVLTDPRVLRETPPENSNGRADYSISH